MLQIAIVVLQCFELYFITCFELYFITTERQQILEIFALFWYIDN